MRNEVVSFVKEELQKYKDSRKALFAFLLDFESLDEAAKDEEILTYTRFIFPTTSIFYKGIPGLWTLVKKHHQHRAKKRVVLKPEVRDESNQRFFFTTLGLRYELQYKYIYEVIEPHDDDCTCDDEDPELGDFIQTVVSVYSPVTARRGAYDTLEEAKRAISKECRKHGLLNLKTA